MDGRGTTFVKKNDRVLSHLVQAFFYSRDGFVAAVREEIAFRLVLFETAVLCPLAFLLASGWAEAVLLCLPSFLCILVELLNSALENTVNRISLELHPLAKKAKDMGSAAQFGAQLFLCLVWGSFVCFD